MDVEAILDNSSEKDVETTLDSNSEIDVETALDNIYQFMNLKAILHNDNQQLLKQTLMATIS